jgi:uncharacterized membrane protein
LQLYVSVDAAKKPEDFLTCPFFWTPMSVVGMQKHLQMHVMKLCPLLLHLLSMFPVKSHWHIKTQDQYHLLTNEHPELNNV